MSEHNGTAVRTEVVYTENGVEIDGIFIPAITLLEAARIWFDQSDRRGWDLRNLHGLIIDKPAYVRDYWTRFSGEKLEECRRQVAEAAEAAGRKVTESRRD